MTLEDKWKKAEEDLEDFNKSMELIKKFPLKGPVQQVKCAPYEIEKPTQYPQSYFWK